MTREDVLRIVRRDFPNGDEDAALAILDQYGTEPEHRDRDRIQLAILKRARGQLDQLQEFLAEAQNDAQSFLFESECPYSGRLEPAIGDLYLKPPYAPILKEAERSIYQEWLHSEAYCGVVRKLPGEMQKLAQYERVSARRSRYVAGAIFGVLVALPVVLARVLRINGFLVLVAGAVIGLVVSVLLQARNRN